MRTATSHGTTIILRYFGRRCREHSIDMGMITSIWIPQHSEANLRSNHDWTINIWSNALSTFSFDVPTRGFSDYVCILLINKILLGISPFTSSLFFRSAKFHEFRILVAHSPFFYFLSMFFCSPFQNKHHLWWSHTFFAMLWNPLHSVSRKTFFIMPPYYCIESIHRNPPRYSWERNPKNILKI